jgi:hypothetical protein
MISRTGSPATHRKQRVRALRLAVAGAALLLCLPLAHAEDAVPIHPALHDRFYVGLGAFVPKTSTSAQLNSSTLGVGTNIDFERALGMRTQKTLPDFFARFRLTDRWRFEAEYFQLNRTGDKVTQNQIQWGDVIFPVNTQIQSKFDFSDTRVSAGYSFFRTADKELGVGFGFHLASYDVALSTAATGNQASKVLAPLPVLSAYGQFALTETWAVGGRLDRFVMTYDNYYGNITSLALDVNYQPFRHIGFGLAYRSLNIFAKATGSALTAEFNQTFQGPLLYMNASF